MAKAAVLRFADLVNSSTFGAIWDKLMLIKGFIWSKEALDRQEQVLLGSTEGHALSSDIFGVRMPKETLEQAIANLALKFCPTHPQQPFIKI